VARALRRELGRAHARRRLAESRVGRACVSRAHVDARAARRGVLARSQRMEGRARLTAGALEAALRHQQRGAQPALGAAYPRASPAARRAARGAPAGARLQHRRVLRRHAAR
jgi:hypothetical protein